MTRRKLLTGTAGLITSAVLKGAGKHIPLGANVILPGVRPVRTMMGQIGYRESDDPGVLAQAHKRLGYTAAFCPAGRPGDTARVNAIRTAFEKAGVVIAEVGAWENMMTPDLGRRKANIDYVIHQMALAEELGVRCCVDVAGSFDGNTLSGPDPRNLSKEFFDGTVENCRRIIDSVKPKVASFSIEMKGWNIPDGPDSYLALIQAVDRPRFGVHMDICNVINSPWRFYNSGAFIEETFRKLGKWVLSCHAKDLKWVPEQGVHFVEVPPGQGGIDWRAYLTQIGRTNATLLLEHFATNEDFQQGAKYIRKLGSELGISL